jgi:CHC2 zinc finger/Toprim-like
MARIAEEQLARLKQEVSVQRLAEGAGVALARHGADLIGLCPFHDDREPSLVITPAKNLWHCLGACNAGGSAIDWVMKAQGVSFRHAVELLRADLPSFAAGSVVRPVKRSTVKRMDPPVEIGADDRALLSQVVGYYHETFKGSLEAQSYLRRRGLSSSEMVERFRVGFANRTLGYRLPEKTRVAGEKMRSRLQALGILRESGHEHFNGSVVIPVFGVREASGLTDQEDVKGIYGRKITHGLRKGTPLHLYLPGPHRGVFNEAAVAASPEIILCEAILDALTFWCAGYRNVTSSYGVNGFTDDHLAAFRKWGTRRVLVAYDRDDAGEKAATALAQNLLAAGLDCYRIQFPKGMDANEYAQKVKPAEKALGILIRNAAWMGKGRPPSQRIGLGSATVAATAVAGEATKEETLPEPPSAGLPPRPAPASSLAAKDEGGEPVTPPSPAASPSPSAVAETSAAVPAALPPATVEDPAPPLSGSPLASELPAASPLPPPPAAPAVSAEVNGDEVTIVLGDRRYRIRGLGKNLSFDAMKVNLFCGKGEGFYVDTLDLYVARQRAAFIKAASEEIGVTEDAVKKDLGRVLLKLEELQEEQIKKAMEPKAVPLPEMSMAERDAALSLLRDPHLLDRIVADFTRCGIVGEETNKLMGYLCAVSRKLDEPLAVILQSSSAAGKTALMEAVLSFVPEEDQVKYSAMTGQSLFYLGEKDLRHKVLAIAEEEGVRQAAYALKLLQSEGELTIASTGKDPATGKLVTHEYRVEGPVMIFMTTTAVTIEDEELQNRCVILGVDEDREQTKAIHALQREHQTIEGLLARQRRAEVRKVHRNAQRLLRALPVVNPYAKMLTFRDDTTRTRRDHVKYLTLIRAIAQLHQHQREVKIRTDRGQKTEYIEATLEDIATANALAHEVLGRSLDEISPQTRRLLLLLDEMVSGECERLAMSRADFRFRRKDVRAHTGWSDFQVRTHIEKLVSLEYVLVHRGSRGQNFVYELLYDGKGRDGAPRLMGLIDVERLANHVYDKKFEGGSGKFEHEKGKFEGPSSIQSAPFEPPSSMDERPCEPAPGAASPVLKPESSEKVLIRDEEKNQSYVAASPCHSDARDPGGGPRGASPPADNLLPLAAASPAAPRPA